MGGGRKKDFGYTQIDISKHFLDLFPSDELVLRPFHFGRSETEGLVAAPQDVEYSLRQNKEYTQNAKTGTAAALTYPCPSKI